MFAVPVAALPGYMLLDATALMPFGQVPPQILRGRIGLREA